VSSTVVEFDELFEVGLNVQKWDWMDFPLWIFAGLNKLF